MVPLRRSMHTDRYTEVPLSYIGSGLWRTGFCSRIGQVRLLLEVLVGHWSLLDAMNHLSSPIHNPLAMVDQDLLRYHCTTPLLDSGL